MLEVKFALQSQILPSESWKLVNIFEWYERRFKVYIKVHHDGEEEIFFPAMKKKTQFPESLTEEHKTLLKLLEDISVLGKSFTKHDEDSTRNTLVRLRTKWTELESMMMDHLNEEEEFYKTKVKESFTEGEMNKLIKKIVQSPRETCFARYPVS